MNRLALATAISTLMIPGAFAADVYHFNTTMASGTASDPMASFVNIAAGPVNIWYVDPASGTASDRNTPATQLIRSSEWTFDFTNPAAVSFSGALYLGNYSVQTSLNFPTVDGRQTFNGVVQSFAGTGAFDSVTNTFTYQFSNLVSNGGGGSVFSAAASTTCVNGKTSTLGRVCSVYSQATPSWEGLSLSFVFAADKSSFTGSLQGRDKSGVHGSLTQLTSLSNWHVWDGSPVLVNQANPEQLPVPASAWLFGSALVGLAAATRHRRSAQ